jgi:hypothetical protein
VRDALDAAEVPQALGIRDMRILRHLPPVQVTAFCCQGPRYFPRYRFPAPRFPFWPCHVWIAVNEQGRACCESQTFGAAASLLTGHVKSRNTVAKIRTSSRAPVAMVPVFASALDAAGVTGYSIPPPITAPPSYPNILRAIDIRRNTAMKMAAPPVALTFRL